MQASTYMTMASFRPGASDTHRRLLEAAARVFAQSGLEGATTREIAREAGVNEVTLFRHFQTKEKLLGAVLRRTFDSPEEMLPTGEAALATPAGDAGPDGFRAGLRQYAWDYAELLQRNILLVRTLIGEIHRHREHEKQVLTGIFAPLKADLIALIREARERGTVRADVDPLVAADLLGSMIFMDVLRRTSPFTPDYPEETYLGSALEVFARGIEQPAGAEGAAPQP